MLLVITPVLPDQQAVWCVQLDSTVLCLDLLGALLVMLGSTLLALDRPAVLYAALDTTLLLDLLRVVCVQTVTLPTPQEHVRRVQLGHTVHCPLQMFASNVQLGLERLHMLAQANVLNVTLGLWSQSTTLVFAHHVQLVQKLTVGCAYRVQ